MNSMASPINRTHSGTKHVAVMPSILVERGSKVDSYTSQQDDIVFIPVSPRRAHCNLSSTLSKRIPEQRAWPPSAQIYPATTYQQAESNSRVGTGVWHACMRACVHVCMRACVCVCVVCVTSRHIAYASSQ